MRITRRKFLQLGAEVGMVAACPFAFADDAKPLNVIPIDVSLGATKPFQALHVSDSHLCLADKRDVERKIELAEARRRYFVDGEKFLDAALVRAREKNELFLYTGDLIDFVSEQNLDAIAAKLRDANVFGAAGNHEFSQFVGEAKEDAAYKAQSFDRVQRAYPNDLAFDSRVVEGVNFVAFDDVYYYVAEDLQDKFQKEIDKGLPIVALCHCPLYTPELFNVAMSQRNAKSSYLVGVPEEATKEFDPNRREQQRANATTLDFIAWLRERSLLKAIFCGHLHYRWSGPFSKTATQYVVGGNFNGDAYEITFR